VQEVELKFQVPADRRLIVDAALAGRSPGRRVRLQAAYYDLPDRALAQAGLALRVRREGPRCVQTLKGPGRDGMSRVEHSVVLPSPARVAPEPDPAHHAGTKVGARLLALLDRHPGAALEMRYRTDVLRRTRLLRTRLGVLELAFDQGSVESGDRRIELSELEIELKSGSPLAVIECARSWQRRYGLWLDTRSKAERGDLLARGESVAAARMASPVELTRGMTVAEALRAVQRNCADQIVVNASQIASGEHDAEHVHQLRVGLRRLRSALRLFAGAGSAPALADAAAAVFRSLGSARDRDVLAGVFGSELQSALAGIELDEVPMLNRAGAPVLAPVDAVRATPAQTLLLDLLAAGSAAVDEPDSRIKAATGLRKQLVRRLDRWHRVVLADAERFEQLDRDERHVLRKRLKRLRYGVEFAAGLFGKRALRRYLRRLSAAQDRLGELTDVVMATRVFERARFADPRARVALGWLAARHDELVGQALPDVRAFAAVRRCWGRD
jgi:triphosphatase